MSPEAKEEAVTDPNEPYWKPKVLQILSEAEKDSQKVRARAQEVVETMTISGSLAGHLRKVLSDAPDDSAMPEQDWRHLCEDWQAYRVNLGTIFVNLSSSSTATATGQAAALTTAMSEPRFSGWISKPGRQALDEMKAILHRPTLLQDAIDLLNRHQIVEFGGERSPQTLLEEAHAALSRPSLDQPNVTAVLLTARSALSTMLSSLLPRRAKQEKAGKTADKVTSLGRQLGIPTLDSSHFTRLGLRAEELMDSLSAGKGKAITEPELSRRFDQALSFIIAFLSSLDLLRTTK